MLKQSSNGPVIAIVGRANVGKSTLWNRLTETTTALVSNEPHTTRDRKEGEVIWRGGVINVVDTGGMDADQGSEIGRGILHQAEIAIQKADLVLFLVDAKAGILPQDHDLALHAKKLNKHIILVANKADRPNDAYIDSQGLWSLQLGEPTDISAGTGRGIGDLLDLILAKLAARDKHPVPITEHEGLKLVIMGRPNVGKSSLMNAILGEERVIVSAIAHTTREPQDTTFEYKDERVTLIDTAGMRKRSHIEPGIEEAGIDRNRAALMQADVALLVFDATQDPTTQDRHLAGLMQDAGRGLILVANKWDLVEKKSTQTSEEYEKLIRQLFPFLSWAPMIFVSATHNQRTQKILDIAFRIRDERKRTITYNALQRFLKGILAKRKPLANLGPSSPYVHDVNQIGVNPPSFLILVRGEKESLHPSWIKYFENRLREKFGFEGTPIEVRGRNMPMPRNIDDASARAAAKRPTRRKPPIGRRIGRY